MLFDIYKHFVVGMSDSVLGTGDITVTTTNQKNIEPLCSIKKSHKWDLKIMDGIGRALRTPTHFRLSMKATNKSKDKFVKMKVGILFFSFPTAYFHLLHNILKEKDFLIWYTYYLHKTLPQSLKVSKQKLRLDLNTTTK